MVSETELRLRAVLDSMEDGVVVQDRDGKVISTNAAAQRILRASAPHLQTQSAHGPPLAPLIRRDGSPFPDDERPAGVVLRTGLPVRDCVMGLAAVGAPVIWISANATPLRNDPDAPIQGVVLTIRDISEHVRLQDESQRAREALQRSEERFKTLVGFAPVGIYETDPYGQTIYVNERAVEIAGMTEAQVIGEGWLRAVHPDDLPALQAARVEARAKGTGLSHDVRFVGPQGIVHAQLRSLPMSSNGVVTGYLGALVDVTELRTAQAALARSEASFRTLSERAPVGIGVAAAARVLFANPALAKLLGARGPEELIGRNVLDLPTARSRAALSERFERLARGEKVPSEVFAIQRADGSEALLDVDSVCIDFRGTPAVMSMLRDVTELERARAERDAAHRKLLESLGEKETLLKEIHHRVKNNLQVIASLLRLGRRNVHDERAQQVFDDSIDRVHSIGLIHERLYQSTDLDRIDMAPYLQGLVSELVRANTMQHQVRASVLCAPLFLAMDQCVPIGLIVNELVSNALKHAFKGSKPGRAPVLVVALAEHNGGYELSVRDNGCGLAPSEVPESSLGLRLVASLTQQLQGEHHVESSDGVEWRVTFPRVA